MGNQFDGSKIPQDHSENKFTPKAANSGPDLLLDFLTSSSDQVGKSVDQTLNDSLSEDSFLGAGSRVAYVLGAGAAKSTVGFGNAIVHDLSPEHWAETGFKAGTAFSIGLAMRTLLPKAGAVKAIVGTVMGVSFVKDALTPGIEAVSAALNKQNRKDLDKAADKMGDGYGMFALDSLVGIKLGMKGEHVAGKVIDKHFPGFEVAKSNLFNSTRNPVGKTIKSFAEPVSESAKQVESSLTENRDVIQVALDQQNIAKIKEFQSLRKKEQEVKKLFAEEKTITAGKDKAAQALPPELPVNGQDKYTYDADNLAKIGQIRAEVQNARALEAEQFDHLQNEIIMPTEISQNPALNEKINPAYRQTTDQINALAKRMTNKQNVDELHDFVNTHKTARVQYMFGNPKALDHNNFFIDFWKIKMGGLINKAGVPPETLKQHKPPLTAVLPTNEGPYIQPSIPKVMDTAVAVVEADSRVHRDGPAQSHEADHEFTFNQFLRFDAKTREKWLGDIAKETLKEHGLENKPVTMSNGKPFLDQNGKPVTYEELIKSILKAQPNENSSDWAGVGVSGHALAVQYGALEMSWQGQLGKNSYISPAFADAENALGFEVHNLGRSRILAMAEVLRMRANGHERSLNIANALTNWANRASEAGENYRWEQLKYNEQTGRHSRTGVFVEIPLAVWDTAIKKTAQKQLFQPLERLNGKTLHECLPDQGKVIDRCEDLASKIADAAIKNLDKIEGFDKYRDEFNAKYPDEQLGKMNMVDVFNAGPIAEAIAFATGLSGKEVDARVDRVHSWVRSQFRDHQNEPISVVNSTAPVSPIPVALRIANGAINTWNKFRRMPEAAMTNNIGAATFAINADRLMREHRLKKEMENQQN